MPLRYNDYELPLLEALEKLGGSAKARDVYPVVEKIMSNVLKQHPEEYGKYQYGDIIWKNRTQWAREYLKRKGQLGASKRGVWKITNVGKERLRLWRTTGKDPDAGLEAITAAPEEVGKKPEEVFERQEHRHGGILGVKGIVYEPINEQGVILLFAAVADELGYLIESIRSQFPDAQLARKDEKGTYKPIKAEFEFKSSQFKLHGHDPKQCDLIICWENDWNKSPIEVLALRDVVKRFR